MDDQNQLNISTDFARLFQVNVLSGSASINRIMPDDEIEYRSYGEWINSTGSVQHARHSYTTDSKLVSTMASIRQDLVGDPDILFAGYIELEFNRFRPVLYVFNSSATRAIDMTVNFEVIVSEFLF